MQEGDATEPRADGRWCVGSLGDACGSAQQSLDLISGFTASPVAAYGRIYFTGEECGVCVVKAGPELQLLATNEVGDTCLATPNFADGMLFVRSAKFLIAVERKSE